MISRHTAPGYHTERAQDRGQMTQLCQHCNHCSHIDATPSCLLVVSILISNKLPDGGAGFASSSLPTTPRRFGRWPNQGKGIDLPSAVRAGKHPPPRTLCHRSIPSYQRWRSAKKFATLRSLSHPLPQSSTTPASFFVTQGLRDMTQYAVMPQRHHVPHDETYSCLLAGPALRKPPARPCPPTEQNQEWQASSKIAEEDADETGPQAAQGRNFFRGPQAVRDGVMSLLDGLHGKVENNNQTLQFTGACNLRDSHFPEHVTSRFPQAGHFGIRNKRPLSNLLQYQNPFPGFLFSFAFHFGIRNKRCVLTYYNLYYNVFFHEQPRASIQQKNLFLASQLEWLCFNFKHVSQLEWPCKSGSHGVALCCKDVCYYLRVATDLTCRTIGTVSYLNLWGHWFRVIGRNGVIGSAKHVQGKRKMKGR
jgi:hypothetical protein